MNTNKRLTRLLGVPEQRPHSILHLPLDTALDTATTVQVPVHADGLSDGYEPLVCAQTGQLWCQASEQQKTETMQPCQQNGSFLRFLIRTWWATNCKWAALVPTVTIILSLPQKAMVPKQAARLGHWLQLPFALHSCVLSRVARVLWLPWLVSVAFWGTSSKTTVKRECLGVDKAKRLGKQQERAILARFQMASAIFPFGAVQRGLAGLFVYILFGAYEFRLL